MTDLNRYRVTWSGATALPGVSTFYSYSPDDLSVGLAAFFSSISSHFPNSLRWDMPTSGDKIDSATGHLTGSWSGGTLISQTGSGGATAFAAGCGARILWGTPQIRGTHRLKGRTFLAPMLSSEYSTAGGILAATVTGLTTNAGTLVATGKLVIWGRPHKGLSDGLAVTATSGACDPRVTSLYSRRH